MFCKTIILSNSENLTSNAPKGILTLSKENCQVQGKIRLYNLISLPQSTKIGLYINEKVHISPIVHRQNYYTFNLQENVDISQSVYCALIDASNNKKVLLEGGSFNGFCFTDSPFDAVLEAKDEQLEQTIDNALNDSETCDNCNCTNCEYKKHFYNNYHDKPQNIASKHENSNHFTQDNNCEAYFNPQLQSKVPKDVFDDKIQSNIIDKLRKGLIDDCEHSSYQFDDICNNIIGAKSLENDNVVNESNSIEPSIKQSQQQSQNENTNSNQQEQLDFLNDIVYQLDEILTQNPADDILNSIIPNISFGDFLKFNFMLVRFISLC